VRHGDQVRLMTPEFEHRAQRAGIAQPFAQRLGGPVSDSRRCARSSSARASRARPGQRMRSADGLRSLQVSGLLAHRAGRSRQSGCAAVWGMAWQRNRCRDNDLNRSCSATS
jgi:hypothetical protein